MLKYALKYVQLKFFRFYLNIQLFFFKPFGYQSKEKSMEKIAVSEGVVL